MPRSIEQTSDGGYIVAGSSYSNNGDVSGNHGNSDFWVVRLDASGAIVWQKSLGGSNWDDGFDIHELPGGDYIVAGYTRSSNGDVSGNQGDGDVWGVRLTSTGGIRWQKCLGGSGGDSASDVQPTSDGGVIIAGLSGSSDGDVTGNHGGGDAWLVKLDGASAIQ